MAVINQLKQLLSETLSIDTSDFDEQTELLGAIPEFDSMAIMTLIIEMENQFGVSIVDDDIDAETFATFGSLASFISQ
ncbi:acyl carrier protein [Algicola sagamiensis]|uniref:acyl carrier protein n=1 Tax=Algicola sagamiensis TaxID=163869 RepID=UPI00036DC6DF|nr:phosphopantetheine-binding protein [Algicola sagamiensis]